MGSPTRIQRKPVAGRPNTNHSQRREHQTQEPQIGGAPDEAVSPVASASKTTDASIAIVGNSTRTTAGDVPIASVSDAPVRAKASKDGPSKLHAADSSLSADRVASPTKRGKQFRPLSSAIEPASNASTTVTAAELAIPSTPLTTANFKGHTAGAEVVRTAEKPTRCAPPPPPQDTHRHRRAERRRTRAACVLQYGVSTPGARLAHGLEAWEQKRKRPHLSSPTGAETPVPRSKEPHQKRKRRPLFDGFVPLLRRDGTDPLLPVPPDVEDVVAVSKEGSVEQPMNGSERLASRVRENTGLASTRQRFLILDTLVPCRTQVAENKAAAEAFRAEEGKIAQVMASPREEADRDMALALQLEMEQEAQTEAAPSKTRECVVCGDSLAIPDFPIFRPTDGCAHDVQTCAGCLSRWIGAELDGKGWQSIGCPECARPMSHADVRRAVAAAEEEEEEGSTTDGLFARYDELVTRAALADEPDFAWCLAPGCGSGQVNVAETGQQQHFMACVGCGFEQCLRHKAAWHVGETCEQFDYRESGKKRRDEERLDEEWIRANGKRCPGGDGAAGKGCGWVIEKRDGCDHVSADACRSLLRGTTKTATTEEEEDEKCAHQFCWQCLAPYNEIRRLGNEAHTSECPYHTRNLRYPH
ncbi:hypothetical protein LTR28_000208 [Elasticomyces elasticus]|nr:hypothetical protein LTR28_000208 [Elasticomyces elasticus]